MSLESILGSRKAVIGMVHLEPLPGSPRWAGSMDDVSRAALADARALADGGVDAILVENFGDVPFSRRRASTPPAWRPWRPWPSRSAAPSPCPSASMPSRSDAHVRARRRRRGGRALHPRQRPHGRGGDRSGHPRLGAPTTRSATGALWERIAGARRSRSSPTSRRSTPPPSPPIPIEHEARDCVHRGLADGLIVSGEATGLPPKTSDLERVRARRARGTAPRGQRRLSRQCRRLSSRSPTDSSWAPRSSGTASSRTGWIRTACARLVRAAGHR